MKLKKHLYTLISFVFPTRRQPAAETMIIRIMELEAQNEALIAANERLMQKLNADTMQLYGKGRNNNGSS